GCGRKILDACASQRVASTDGHQLTRRTFRRQGQRHRDVARLLAEMDVHLHDVTGLVRRDTVVERLHIVDRLSVDREDYVADLQSGIRRRTTGINVAKEDTVRNRDTE